MAAVRPRVARVVQGSRRWCELGRLPTGIADTLRPQSWLSEVALKPWS